MDETMLYLVRHGAAEANLANPPVLLGCRLDPPLAPLGVRQAEQARDALASVRLGRCYSSPLRRALETAHIVSAPHGLAPPEILTELTECDLGRWEGLDWDTVRVREPEEYERFRANPSLCGHPGGESYSQVHRRAWQALDRLLRLHAGAAVLVVTHQVLIRTCLTALWGRSLDEARQVSLANGSVSLVVRQGERTFVRTPTEPSWRSPR